MASRNSHRSHPLLTLDAAIAATARPRQFKDTDPQMLFAIWQMELGADPDRSLDEVQDAEVVYDKFRPRLAPRR